MTIKIDDLRSTMSIDITLEEAAAIDGGINPILLGIGVGAISGGISGAITGGWSGAAGGFVGGGISGASGPIGSLGAIGSAFAWGVGSGLASGTASNIVNRIQGNDTLSSKPFSPSLDPFTNG